MLQSSNAVTRVADKIKWLVAALLYCYIIYRALNCGITQDEAFSYYLVKNNNINAMAVSANTHWLNSVVMKIFLQLPGFDSLWKIRMLPLLCWPLYCLGVIRVSQLFTSKILGFTFFIVAVFNTFLLFYFSIARGYAPAVTFIMLALWQAAVLTQAAEFRPARWLKVFIPAALAVSSNFSAFYFFMALTVVYIASLVFNRQRRLLWARPFQPLNLLIAGLSLLTVSALLLIKYYGHDLEYGSTVDPVGSLFGSLIANSRNTIRSVAEFFDEGHNSYAEYSTYGVLLAALLTSALVYSVVQLLRKKKITIGTLTIFVNLLVLCIALLFALIFKTPYLLDRSSLILFPSVLINLFWFADSLSLPAKLATPVRIVLASVTVFLCLFNFSKSHSPFYFREWTVQADTKEGLDYLHNAGAKNVGLDLWQSSLLANYYSQAYPGRYKFNVHLIGMGEILTLKDELRFDSLDHLFLSPPHNNTEKVLVNWMPVIRFTNSDTKILARKTAGVLRTSFIQTKLRFTR